MSEKNVTDATAPRSVDQQQACSPAPGLKVLSCDERDKVLAIHTKFTADMRFAAWFANWRGVFANEAQARVMFDESQPENEKAEARGTATSANQKLL